MMLSLKTLVIGGVTFLLLILTIRASKVRIRDAVFWIIWAIMLLVISFFPEFYYWAYDLLKFEQIDNMLLVFLIIFSYFAILKNNVTISQHENKIKELTQIIGIYELEQKKVNQELKNEIENKVMQINSKNEDE